MSILVYGIHAGVEVLHIEQEVTQTDPTSGKSQIVKSKFPEIILNLGNKRIGLPNEKDATFEKSKKFYLARRHRIQIAMRHFRGYDSVMVKDFEYDLDDPVFNKWLVGIIHDKLWEFFQNLNIEFHPYENESFGWWSQLGSENHDCVVGVYMTDTEPNLPASEIKTDMFQFVQDQFKNHSRRLFEEFGKIELKPSLWLIH